MTLHCAATLLLVLEEAAGDDGVDGVDGVAAVHGPWADGADVIAELQHVADQYRGERVLVTLGRDELARVARHLEGVSPRGSAPRRLRLEVGDDGWALVPWDAE